MRRLQTKDPTLVQVLSLYLLLLAFFIVMFNASRYDASRGAAVGESLSSTFEPRQGRPGEARQNVSQEGSRLGDEAVLKRVGNLVKTELRVARVRVVKPGRLMEARIPADRLFAPGTAALTPEAGRFVTGFAPILGERSAGRRHKVDIHVGSGLITPDKMTTSAPLAIARAAAFAKALLGQGAIAGTVMSGVSFAHPRDVVLVFRIDRETRPEDRELPGGPGAGG